MLYSSWDPLYWKIRRVPYLNSLSAFQDSDPSLLLILPVTPPLRCLCPLWMEMGCQSNGAAREKISRHKSQALESYPNVVLPFTLMYYILFCCIILECLSKPVLWHYLLPASYWLCGCISVQRNKKKKKVYKLCTGCSWAYNHYIPSGHVDKDFNGCEPAISVLVAIRKSPPRSQRSL